MTSKKQARTTNEAPAPEQAQPPDSVSAALTSPLHSVSRPRTDESSAGPAMSLSGDFIDLQDLRLTKPTNNAEFVATVGAGIQFGMTQAGGIVSRIYFHKLGGPVYVDIVDTVSKAYRTTVTVFVGSGEFGTLRKTG